MISVMLKCHVCVLGVGLDIKVERLIIHLSAQVIINVTGSGYYWVSI